MTRYLFWLLLATAQLTNAQPQVLLYGYTGKGYVHDNIPTSLAALAGICEQNGWIAEVAMHPSVFHADTLMRFKAIVFANTNAEAFHTDAQREAFQQFILAGGGFVGIHSASTSEPQWAWFTQLVGGRFVRHPPLQPFAVRVIQPHHAATAHLADSLLWTDECYLLEQLNPMNQILLTADLRTVTDTNGDECGAAFGHHAPLAWYKTQHGGRQFYTALGHPIAAYSDFVFLRHVAGGLRWVLGK